MTEQVWYKPKQIADEGLILDPSGNKSYRYILRLIKTNQLKAKIWAEQGVADGSIKPYYMVHIDEIRRFNNPEQEN